MAHTAAQHRHAGLDQLVMLEHPGRARQQVIVRKDIVGADKSIAPDDAHLQTVFCATIEFSISVVMNMATLNGKKLRSHTTLSISWQPQPTLTLLPMMQLSITAPAPMVQLSRWS